MRVCDHISRGPFLAALALILCFSATSAWSQTRPRIPYYDRGACPFECCTYRDWSVDKATLVRTAMRDSAPVAFRLRRGERVRGLTGTVITTQAGVAEVMKGVDETGLKLAVGDRIYLLNDVGEGYMTAWFKGRTFAAEAYIPSEFKILSHPKTVWWVKVRNRAGKIGWTREPENFGNKDQCG